jgi:hypothetical protein
MASINQLSTISTLQGGDLLAVWSSNNGDSRKSSITTLMDYVNANVTDRHAEHAICCTCGNWLQRCRLN